MHSGPKPCHPLPAPDSTPAVQYNSQKQLLLPSSTCERGMEHSCCVLLQRESMTLCLPHSDAKASLMLLCLGFPDTSLYACTCWERQTGQPYLCELSCALPKEHDANIGSRGRVRPQFQAIVPGCISLHSHAHTLCMSERCHGSLSDFNACKLAASLLWFARTHRPVAAVLD